jgi:hypothetical protein
VIDAKQRIEAVESSLLSKIKVQVA